jgi:hypothetical protein
MRSGNVTVQRRTWWTGLAALPLALGLVLGACSDDGEETATDAPEAEGADAGEARGLLCEADMIVFLTPGVAQPTVDAAREAIVGAAEVEAVDDLDAEEVQPLYEAMFTDAPPVEDPADLPIAYAVVLRGNVDQALVIGDLYATEGIGEVASVDGQACAILDGEVGTGIIGDSP